MNELNLIVSAMDRLGQVVIGQALELIWFEIILLSLWIEFVSFIFQILIYWIH